MRSKIMQFTVRMVVAFGIAVLGVIAISDVVAYSSSAERAWVVKESLSPLRSPAAKAEFRLGEYQQLNNHFFQRQPLR